MAETFANVFHEYADRPCFGIADAAAPLVKWVTYKQVSDCAHLIGAELQRILAGLRSQRRATRRQRGREEARPDHDARTYACTSDGRGDGVITAVTTLGGGSRGDHHNGACEEEDAFFDEEDDEREPLVGVCMHNALEFLLLDFACTLASLVLVPVHPQGDHKTIESVINQSTIIALIYSGGPVVSR